MGTYFKHLNVPDQWNQYWSKYPNGYTILEALLNWVKSVDDLTDNINDWNTRLDEFINTYSADVKDAVIKTLSDWQASGFLSVVIDEALQTELDTFEAQVTAELELKATQADLEAALQEVNDLTAKIKVLLGNTYGTFANAALQSVIANKPTAVPQVLGITPENDQVLATYDARDTVASYRANFTRQPTLVVDNVSFTVNTVQVPAGTDLSKVKAGMIIDTKHQTKYSAIIKGIDGNTIQVYNWYAMGNTNKGQVPSNTAGINIDPVSHIWVDNVNLTLENGDPEAGATIVEYGMFNNQSDGGIRNGIQMLSLGDHIPDTGYVASSSGQNNKWQCGFKDHNSITAFGSENSNSQEALLFNSGTGFKIKNHGQMNRLKLEVSNSNLTHNVHPDVCSLFIITDTTPHTIAEASVCAADVCFIKNNTGSDVAVGALTIPANAMQIIFSDGAYWYAG